MSIWKSLWGKGPTNSPSTPKFDVGVDISEVYSRIHIAGMPYNRVTMVDGHRNNAAELLEHLDTKFKKDQWIIFNLTNRCQVSSDVFRGQVLNFPPLLNAEDIGYSDDGLPQIEEIFRFIYALHFWLSSGSEHVAVVHDTSGRHRSPFMVACYLTWAHSGVFSDSIEALTRVLEIRVPNRHMKFLRTWWRTLLTFDQVCARSNEPVAPQWLNFTSLLVFMDGRIRNVPKEFLNVLLYQGSECIWESGNSPHDLRWESGCLKANVNVPISGDVQVHIVLELPVDSEGKAISLFDADGNYRSPSQQLVLPSGEIEVITHFHKFSRRPLIRYQFHTNTLPADAIQIPITHVDILRPELVKGVDEDGKISSSTHDFWMQLILTRPDYIPEYEEHRKEIDRIKNILLLENQTTETELRSNHDSEVKSRDSADISEVERLNTPEPIKNWLNLRGRTSLLCGLAHFSNAHSIVPQPELVDILVNSLGLPDRIFAVAALQLASRGTAYARALLMHQPLVGLWNPNASTSAHSFGLSSSLIGGSFLVDSITDEKEVPEGCRLVTMEEVMKLANYNSPAKMVLPVLATTMTGELMRRSSLLSPRREEAEAKKSKSRLDIFSSSSLPVSQISKSGSSAAATAPAEDLNSASGFPLSSSLSDQLQNKKNEIEQQRLEDLDFTTTHAEIAEFLTNGLKAMLDADDSDWESNGSASGSESEADSDEDESVRGSRRKTSELTTPSRASRTSRTSELFTPLPRGSREDGMLPAAGVHLPGSSLHPVAQKLLSPSFSVISRGDFTESLPGVNYMDSSSQALNPVLASMARDLSVFTPGRVRALQPILGSIAHASTPSLLLAGLQFAAAVETCGIQLLTQDAVVYAGGQAAAGARPDRLILPESNLEKFQLFQREIQNIDVSTLRQVLGALQGMNRMRASLTNKKGLIAAEGTDLADTVRRMTMEEFGSMSAEHQPPSAREEYAGEGNKGQAEEKLDRAYNATRQLQRDLLLSLVRETNLIDGPVSSDSDTDGDLIHAKHAHAMQALAKLMQTHPGLRAVVDTLLAQAPVLDISEAPSVPATSVNVPLNGVDYSGAAGVSNSLEHVSSEGVLLPHPIDVQPNDSKVEIVALMSPNTQRKTLAAVVPMEKSGKTEVSPTSTGSILSSLSSNLMDKLSAAITPGAGTGTGSGAGAGGTDSVIASGTITTGSGTGNASLSDLEQKMVEKYRKMLQIGIQPMAVMQKVKLEVSSQSLGESVSDSTPTTDVDLEKLLRVLFADMPGIPLEKAKPVEKEKVAEKEKPKELALDIDPEKLAAATEKYGKMLKLGVPPGAVALKMQQEGYSNAIISKVLGSNTPQEFQVSEESKTSRDSSISVDGSAPPEGKDAKALFEEDIARLKVEQKEREAENHLPLHAHPLYKQFSKDQKIGVPEQVLAASLAAAGLNPEAAGWDWDAPTKDPHPPLQSHPHYGKYFRMLKFGIPPDSVKHKMEQEGADPRALSLVMELPCPLRLEPSELAKVALAKANKGKKKPRILKKKLHWDVISSEKALQQGTIWASTRKKPRSVYGENGAMENDENQDSDYSSYSSNSDFSDEEFNKLFTALPSQGHKSSLSATSATSSNSGQTIINLVDPKRGRSVAIGLGKLRLPFSVIRQCLLSMSVVYAHGEASNASAPKDHPEEITDAQAGSTNTQELTLEQLQILQDIVPAPEEIATVKSFRGDKNRLGECERFFSAIMDVSRPRARAQFLLFQKTAASRMAEVVERADRLLQSCEAVKRSENLKKILEVVLKLGNKLNEVDIEGEDEDTTFDLPSARSTGSMDTDSKSRRSKGKRKPKKSGAAGFTLNSLLQLANTKSFDGKVSVLQYLVQYLERKNPESLNVVSELEFCQEISRLDSKILDDDCSSIRRDLDACSKLLHDISSTSTSTSSSSSSSSTSATAGVSHSSTPEASTSTNASNPQLALMAAIRARQAPKKQEALQVSKEDTVTEPSSASQPPSSSSSSNETSSTVNVTALQDFIARTQTELISMMERVEAAKTSFKDLVFFFGEDEHMTVETYFATLHKFIRSIASTIVVIREQEERSAREARRSLSGRGLSSGKIAPSAPAALGASAEPPAVAGLEGVVENTSLFAADSASTAESSAFPPNSVKSRARANKGLEDLFQARANHFVRTGGIANVSGSSRSTGSTQISEAHSAPPSGTVAVPRENNGTNNPNSFVISTNNKVAPDDVGDAEADTGSVSGGRIANGIKMKEKPIARELHFEAISSQAESTSTKGNINLDPRSALLAALKARKGSEPDS